MRRLMTPVVMMVGAWAFVLMAQGGCGQAGTGGSIDLGDDSGMFVNQDPVVSPGTELPGLFSATDVWSLGSQNVIMFGFGAYVEVLSILDDQGDGCLGLESPIAASFEEGRIALDGAFTSSGRSCAIGVSARVDACGVEPGVPLDTLQQCDLEETSGTLTVGRDEAEPTDLILLQFPRCEDVPLTLVGEGDWGIVSIHPLALPFVEDPASIGGVVVIAGVGRSTDRASVLTGLNGDDVFGCVDDTPDGDLTWDGQRLRINLDLEGDDNSESLGAPGNCSISFDGSLTYCAEINPSDLGSSGDAGKLIRVDGAGSFTSNDGTGVLTSMYLLVMEPAVRRNRP
ncbi:MAG: hypothetical protein AABZ47_01160 [Planctomycetota bacterium]